MRRRSWPITRPGGAHPDRKHRPNRSAAAVFRAARARPVASADPVNRARRCERCIPPPPDRPARATGRPCMRPPRPTAAALSMPARRWLCRDAAGRTFDGMRSTDAGAIAHAMRTRLNFNGTAQRIRDLPHDWAFALRRRRRESMTEADARRSERPFGRRRLNVIKITYGLDATIHFRYTTQYGAGSSGGFSTTM